MGKDLPLVEPIKTRSGEEARPCPFETVWTGEGLSEDVKSRTFIFLEDAPGHPLVQGLGGASIIVERAIFRLSPSEVDADDVVRVLGVKRVLILWRDDVVGWSDARFDRSIGVAK